MNTIQTRKPEPSVAVDVVTAVARRAGVDETDLSPLSEVIDPDALDGVFAKSLEEPANGTVRVGFEYCGYTVVVEEDRTVSIGRSGGRTEATAATGDVA